MKFLARPTYQNSNILTESEIDALLAMYSQQDHAHSDLYYLKSETYTQAEVDALVAVLDGQVDALSAAIDALPYVYGALESSNEWTQQNTFAGKVGIGQPTPGRKLDVTASEHISARFMSSYTASSKYYSATYVGYAEAANQGAQFGWVYDSGTPANSIAHITPYGNTEGTIFSIRTGGNVGIGTATPASKLEVRNGDLLLTHSTPGYNNAPTGSYLAWTDYGGNVSARIRQTDALYESYSSSLVFETRNQDSGLALAERMRLNSTGLGIGTTTPLTLLHIHGGVSDNTARTMLQLSTIGGYESYSAKLQIVRGSNLGQKWKFISRRDSDGAEIDALNISDTGRLGILTAAPGRELDVNGSLRLSAANPTLDWNSNTLALTSYSAAIPVLHLKGNGNDPRLDISKADGSTVSVRISANADSYFNGGEVGIGTASPSNLLEVYCTSGTHALRLNSNFSGANYVDLRPYIYGVSNAGFSIGLNGTDQLVLNSTGSLGVGTTAPQGKLHVHDGTGGMMFISKTGIGATPVTLIPNGTGDCTKYLDIRGVCAFSGGATGSLSSSRANPSDATLVTSGANTFALRVNADGSVDIRRTGGTETLSISVVIIWQ